MATEPATRPPLIPGAVESRRHARRARAADPRVVLGWLLVTLVVLGVSVVVVLASGMRPGYDAFGWMVWGHQVLHWNLNTDGAPSWKPLTFLFTLPYALAGSGQVWLWMVTVGRRCARRAVCSRPGSRTCSPGRVPQRPYAPYVAGACRRGRRCSGSTPTRI